MGFRKFVRRTVRKAENAVKKYDPMAKQMGIGGAGGGDDSSTPDKGPQFSDQARQVAAGAGTVGFTQRTQNY